jgi:hypothetical protein
MFNDRSFLAMNNPDTAAVLADADHAALEEQNESMLTWESAWIDIGGEG